MAMGGGGGGVDFKYWASPLAIQMTPNLLD